MKEKIVGNWRIGVPVIGLILAGWLGAEAWLEGSYEIWGVRSAVLVGLASYPVLFWIFRRGFEQESRSALWFLVASIGFKLVVVILSAALFVVGFGLDLMFHIFSLFFILIVLHFAALLTAVSRTYT